MPACSSRYPLLLSFYNPVANASGDINVSRVAVSIPEPTISWNSSSGGENFNPSDISQNTVFLNGSELVVSVLQLRSLQLSDTGIYSCTAMNTVVGGIVMEDTRNFILILQCKLCLGLSQFVQFDLKVFPSPFQLDQASSVLQRIKQL